MIKLKRLIREDFYSDCEEYSKRHKPKTKFQKENSRLINYGNKKAYQFPLRGEDERLPNIPRNTRITSGTEPTQEELRDIKNIYKYVLGSESPFKYIPVWILVYFIGRDISHQLIWLVKNGFATLNVNRMGEAVYIKIK